MSLATLTRRHADPAKRWEVTARAMRLYLLQCQGEEYWEQGVGYLAAMTRPVVTESDYRDRLSEVRDAAVFEHEHGGNCLTGTEDFLEAFGLEPLEVVTLKYVTVQVTVYLQVENTASEEDTYDDVRQNLRLNVDGYVDDIESEEVVIQDVHASTCCHTC